MRFSTKFVFIYFCWITSHESYLSTALKIVHVTIPSAVRSGESALLRCEYDLEQDTLYAVKWYKGNREFYRYTPETKPSRTFFAAGSPKVELSQSNDSTVLLAAMEPNNSGRYSCEVSADAPFFHTVAASGALEVVELPKTGPQISALERFYRIGDIFSANCSISTRRPLVTLTWLVNNNTAHPQQIHSFMAFKDDLSLGSTTLMLMLVLQPKHFRSGNLTLACRANIYDIYEQTTMKTIELDATSYQIQAYYFNTFGGSSSGSSDQKALYDEDENEEADDNMDLVLGNDIHMNHIIGSHTMAASSPSTHRDPAIKYVLLLLLFFPTLTSTILTELIDALSTSKINANIMLRNSENQFRRSHKHAGAAKLQTIKLATTTHFIQQTYCRTCVACHCTDMTLYERS